MYRKYLCFELNAMLDFLKLNQNHHERVLKAHSPEQHSGLIETMLPSINRSNDITTIPFRSPLTPKLFDGQIRPIHHLPCFSLPDPMNHQVLVEVTFSCEGTIRTLAVLVWTGLLDILCNDKA
jgi:hypothetical protein